MGSRGAGRPPTALGDLVKGAILAALENDPSRDALSEREGLVRWFGRVPSAYQLRRAMLTERMNEALKSLIAEIAKHVYHLERWYSIDSTELRSPYYRQIRVVKDGDGNFVPRKVKSTKFVIIRGLRTGVPVLVMIADGYESDKLFFRPMFDQLMASGAIVRGGGMLGDAQFNDRHNFDLVAAHGGRAFLDFDSDSASSGGEYAHYDEQFRLYKQHRDEWHAFYDFRVSIETTNHAMKSLKRIMRAQMPLSRENEGLALVAAYALSRLPELRLKYKIDLPFVDAEALAFIDDAIRKKRQAPALGPEEIRIEREQNAPSVLGIKDAGGIYLA